MIIQLRIKENCKAKGVSQKDLAERCGVSAVTLSRIASGQQMPSVETLVKIAAALGVEVSELFAAPSEGVITCPHCGKSIALHPSGVGGCPCASPAEG